MSSNQFNQDSRASQLDQASHATHHAPMDADGAPLGRPIGNIFGGVVPPNAGMSCDEPGHGHGLAGKTGGAGSGISSSHEHSQHHQQHDHTMGTGVGAAPLAGAGHGLGGGGNAVTGAGNDLTSHSHDRSQQHGSGNTFDRSGAGAGVPSSTTAHNDHDHGHKKGVFGQFDMAKDHTSTADVDKGVFGKGDVNPADGVNAPDVHDKSRLPHNDHGHGTSAVNTTGVSGLHSTSAPGKQHGHPEAGLATGTADSRGATGAGLAGGDRELSRTHETHDLHNSNTAHRTSATDGHGPDDGEHKKGIVEKIKEKLAH